MQTDALLRVTSTAICGSDLHMYTGFMVRTLRDSYPLCRSGSLPQNDLLQMATFVISC